MKHIVSFSTGLSSAITTQRVLDRYHDAEIIFMDTTIEDDDNYRFMNQMKDYWQRPVTVLKDGRTPYQVAQDNQIIPNQKIAPCTFELKIKLFTEYCLALGGPLTIHIGYDFTEVHRIEATEQAYASYGWAVDFPLLWKPYEYRPYSQVCREDWGIEPPQMYDLGYTHANCGGCCVKQGQGDWLRTLIYFPARFLAAQEWEQEMRKHPTRKNYAILRDQTGGKVKPLTLREFRLRYEKRLQAQPLLFSSLAFTLELPETKRLLWKLDSQSSCISCGVGDFVSCSV